MKITKHINLFFYERSIRGAKKIVVGAGETKYDGWISLNYERLNLLDRSSFAKYWKENSRTNILAEHVWEHLSISDGYTAALYCFDYLAHGGRLRIAVPDGFHPDKNYINHIKPGGSGIGSDDHKVLYDYITLSKLLTRAGFDTNLLEYWDESGSFNVKSWSAEDGKVMRSIEYDTRNFNGRPNYTSLIIDAIKP